MQTELTSTTKPSAPLPSILDHVLPAERRPFVVAKQRRLGAWGGLLAISAGTGIAVALGGGKRALAAGGVAALALGALRWQLARWFELTPDYEVMGSVGDLELRRYPAYVEARTQLDGNDLGTAMDGAYGRLACYIYGANARHEDIECATPMLTTMRDGVYTTAFIMPPGRPVGTLPQPADLRVELREVPERDLAVLRYRGRFTAANIAAHERALLEQLVHAGLSTRGSITVACYDSPTTLPLLRRNELWIEIV